MADFALFFAPWGPFCGSQRRAPDDGIVFLLRVILEISGNTQSFGLPAKTESGRVGYRKKYRVAGWVPVPAGHCLPPIADHLIKYLIPITKFIQNTNTAPYSKYRPWMPNSHIPKKQMPAFKY